MSPAELQPQADRALRQRRGLVGLPEHDRMLKAYQRCDPRVARSSSAMTMATILIAEDHPDVLHLISDILTERGYGVVTARNGREALQIAKSSQPDLVLMDMNMPILDGWEACCQFKLDRDLRRIPIIALTAYVLPGDQARARQAGCDDYHPKPLDFDILIRQIHDQLARVHCDR